MLSWRKAWKKTHQHVNSGYPLGDRNNVILGGSDIVTYDKKHAFGVGPIPAWHRAPNALTILLVLRAMKVPFVMLLR